MKNYKLILLTLLAFTLTTHAQTYIKGTALIEGKTSTATAAGTTTLTLSSQTIQVLTGTTTQTVKLPNATTLVAGRKFYILNESTGQITLQNNGSTTLAIIYPSQALSIILTSASTSDGVWTVFSGGNFATKNFIYNGEFRFFQRQAPATLTAVADAAYGPDMWKGFTSGTEHVARVAEVITAAPSQYVVQVRQANASVNRVAIGQPIPYGDSVELQGKTVNMSFWARTDSTEVTTLRACIGQWTSTADTITSDIVSSWGATPTWVSNFSCANTPADITISSAWSQISISAAVSSSTNNVYPVIWTPTTESQNDDFYVTQTQLTVGTYPQPWENIRLKTAEDLAQVQRFYEKSYTIDVAPATATYDGSSSCGRLVNSISNAEVGYFTSWKVLKFKTPAVTVYNPNSGATTTCYDIDATTAVNWAASAAESAASTVGTAWRKVTGGSSFATPNKCYWHWTADASL